MVLDGIVRYEQNSRGGFALVLFASLALQWSPGINKRVCFCFVFVVWIWFLLNIHRDIVDKSVLFLCTVVGCLWI
jgi:hypothetical protein